MKLGTCSFSITPDDLPITVGNYSSIGQNLKINMNLNHPTITDGDLVSNYPFYERYGVNYPPCQNKGEVIIGHDVWIADNVTILSGVTIGNGAIIASNSVVTKDVQSFSLVAGNPARVKKFRFTDDVCDNLEDIAWWNWPQDVVMSRLEDFKDIKNFIKKYYKD